MLRSTTITVAILAALLAVSALGCTGGDSPTAPAVTGSPEVQARDAGGKAIWGMYQITIDPATCEAEILPLRQAEFTCNVTQFLQPPKSVAHLLGIKLDLTQTDLDTGYVVCDVTIRHPFPGLDYYRGFDVRGICMGDGSIPLGHDALAVYGGPDDLQLLNADGFARWWNPDEFLPHNNLFGYTQGGLAPKNYTPTATLNGYKYFADELEAEDEVVLDPFRRGAFSPTSVNTRRYEIQFPMIGATPDLRFGYAIDASWDEPDPSGAPDYPIESFPPQANCAEAYLMKVSDAGSTAWYVHDGDYGGYLKLNIEVFDWQAPHNSTGVLGEVVGLWFEGEVVSAPVDLLAGATVLTGSETSSVFQVEIHGLNLTHNGPNEVWIIAENADPNTYEPQFGGDTSPWTWAESPLAAYLRTTVHIADTQPQFAPQVLAIDPDQGNQGDTVPASVTGQYFADGCQVELRESSGPFVIEADNEVWQDETEVTCDLDLTGAPLGLYDVLVINPSLLEGSLEDGFEVVQANVIYVDDSNTSGTEDGSMTYPYNTIQEGLAAASVGWEVWVDDSGNQYTGQVVLVAGVDLKSVNWDNSDGDDEATILMSSTASCVLGADNATIEGFEIDGVRCGIECNGTSPEIIDCRVVNMDSDTARSVWLRNGSHAHLDGVEVYDASNSYYYGYATFYGILIESCDASGGEKVIIEHTVVHHVFSDGLLGGGYCYPHGILISNSDGVQVKNTIVYDVTGGNYHNVYGIRVANSADVELQNVVIYDIEKTHYYGVAYGLHFSGCTNLDVRNVIINRIRRSGGFQSAYGVVGGSSTYTFEYNDVYDCTSALYSGVSPGTGCITMNPLFVNPGTDFHLASGSPCINAGDPLIEDPDGSRSDMGAYGGPGGEW